MKLTTIVPETENAVVAAIGDIHGMEALLDCAVMSVSSRALAEGFTPIFVFLGDLIDRGPNSCEVMSAVAEVLCQFPGSTLMLGNHDVWLLQFLRGDLTQRDFDNWMGNGGAATLESYFGEGDFEFGHMHALGEEANSRFPTHLPLLSSASDIMCFGRFVFVHAGIRPGVPLLEQRPDDLRWIRDDFLSAPAQHSQVIVHGHSITSNFNPEIHYNRIALDTGAAVSGRLSVGVFRLAEIVDLLQCRSRGDGRFDVVKYPIEDYDGDTT
jgi:serine/threonine protein phosphatase 1